MLELNGKYNTAKVFADIIDQATIDQLSLLLDQSFVAGSRIRVMADTHAGAGCVIGTTMTLTDKVVPNLVGVDIGCGMLAIKLNETEVDLPKLDAVINKYVPAGKTVHETPVAASRVGELYAPVNVEYALQSLGTLGGGNHFIELNKDKDGCLWLVIHTGSRHLGVEVCNHYQQLAYKNVYERTVGKTVKETIDRLKSEGRFTEIEGAIKALKENEVAIPKDLCYIEGEDFDNYLHDMRIAQEHAKINRQTIADIVVSRMGWTIVDSFDTIHNYIDVDNMVLRKGAISAQLGERVLIPMNMRDGSLVCIGKGNADYNCSAPHGAGRVLSRAAARNSVSMADFEQTMSGIYSTSVCESTLDESPMAYKPMSAILGNIVDTVDVIDRIVPVYNFKAH